MAKMEKLGLENRVVAVSYKRRPKVSYNGLKLKFEPP